MVFTRVFKDIIGFFNFWEFEAELKRYEERLEEEREREQQEYYKQRQQLEQGDWNIPLVEIEECFCLLKNLLKMCI